MVYFAPFFKQTKNHKPIKMKVIHTIKDLQAELSVLKAQGKKVGWCLLWVLCMQGTHLL